MGHKVRCPQTQTKAPKPRNNKKSKKLTTLGVDYLWQPSSTLIQQSQEDFQGFYCWEVGEPGQMEKLYF
jgi:hypothetical protein